MPLGKAAPRRVSESGSESTLPLELAKRPSDPVGGRYNASVGREDCSSPWLGAASMITLHYTATANGLKAAIALEEMGLEYQVIDYPLFEGRHLTPEFRRLNPNCKLPLIVDDESGAGAEPMIIFETGAILLYLADKTGLFMPKDGPARWEVVKWLIWQVAGHGPMNGQAHHFLRYAPEGEDYAIARYVNEATRLLNVLEYRLRDSNYLGGEQYSIADIAAWPWVQASWLLGIDLASFLMVSRWSEAISARDAVIRATMSPTTGIPSGNTQYRARLTDEQWSNLFGANLHMAATLR